MTVHDWIALIVMVVVSLIGLCYASGDDNGRGYW